MININIYLHICIYNLVLNYYIYKLNIGTFSIRFIISDLYSNVKQFQLLSLKWM